jgi:phage shock protein A
MGIFSRLTDIVNSNIVHMLDRAENPDKMIRLMIQEMEDTLVEVKSQTAKIIADKKFLGRRLDDLRADEQEWHDKAVLAVSKERDDLAKLALEEKSRKVALIAQINEELVGVDGLLAKYRDDIVQLESKLTEAKKKQKNLVMRSQTSSSQLNVREKLKRADSTKATLKFEAMERRVDLMEGKVEAHDFGRGESLDDQFKSLESESQVADELQALKAQLNKE